MLVITRRTNKTEDHKWVDIPGLGSVCVILTNGGAVRIGFEGFDGHKIYRRDVLKRMIAEAKHDGKLEGVDARKKGAVQRAPTETGDGVSADSGGD